MKLSIVMAVYNEKDSIAEVIRRIQKVEIPLKKEIIIIDGCSDDGTRELLREVKADNIKVIFEESKSGKGSALQLGFKYATGDIILIQDADLEIDPFEYPALVKPILDGRTKIVYGSRFINGRGKTGIINYMGNRLMTTTANILFGSNLTDIETCYKVFRREVLDGLEFSCKGFDFDAELTSSFLKKGERIIEVPISYDPRDKKAGKKLHWITGFTSLRAILKTKFSL
ncbi:MAG: glycosyltransferase family 2 protein [Candidatus Omnitrophica bacterium]|nr:glycosyltransferase family 2 protein [Candidatus Omnitrophota bacterium]